MTERQLRLLTPSEAVGPSPLIHILEGHADHVAGVAPTPDGRRVVSASWDGSFAVWDLETGKPSFSVAAHVGLVTAVAVSPDGQTLAAGDALGAVHLLMAPVQQSP